MLSFFHSWYWLFVFSLFVLTTLLIILLSIYRYFPDILALLLDFHVLLIDFWVLILLLYTYFGFKLIYSSIFSNEVYFFDLTPFCDFSRSNFSNKSCFNWMPQILIGYVAFPLPSEYFLISIVISSLYHRIFRNMLHYLWIIVVLQNVFWSWFFI